MKKLFLFLFSFALLQTASAQDGIFNFGIKGGLGKSEVSFNRSSIIQDADKANSWHLGVATRIKVPVLGLYVQPEIYYSRTGGEIQIDEQGFSGSDKLMQDRIDVPVLLGWRLGLPIAAVRLNAGPMAVFMLDNGISDLGQFDNISAKDFVWGYQAGVGVDVWKLSMDVRYEGNFGDFIESKIEDTAGIEGLDFSGKINQWTLSVGYWF